MFAPKYSSRQNAGFFIGKKRSHRFWTQARRNGMWTANRKNENGENFSARLKAFCFREIEPESFRKIRAEKRTMRAEQTEFPLKIRLQPRAENAGGQDCLQLCRGNPGNNRIKYCDSPSLDREGLFFLCVNTLAWKTACSSFRFSQNSYWHFWIYKYNEDVSSKQRMWGEIRGICIHRDHKGVQSILWRKPFTDFRIAPHRGKMRLQIAWWFAYYTINTFPSHENIVWCRHRTRA